MKIKTDRELIKELQSACLSLVERIKFLEDGVQGINLRVHSLEEKSNAIKKG